jgi:hypothetical protein
MLDAETRELLRQQVDRARREQLGQRHIDSEGWISLPEASMVTGIRAASLRHQVVALQLPTQRRGGRKLVQVRDLDRLRKWGESW